jgi:hypothetical protein
MGRWNGGRRREPVESTLFASEAVMTDGDQQDSSSNDGDSSSQDDGSQTQSGSGTPAADGIRQQIVTIGESYYGQAISDRSGPDGKREGWEILKDIFETALHETPLDAGLLQTVQTPGNMGIAWCGIFAISCARKAGLDAAKWNVGSAPSGLASGALYDGGYQPGDILVTNSTFTNQDGQTQYTVHHAILKSQDGDNLVTVNGNAFDSSTGINSCVCEHTPTRADIAYYYKLT